MQEVTGYPLDEFQRQALVVIENGDDLLVTCPTGSGKTVVALTGILLRALDQGKRAILTTPIKALSNQKYAEFDKWMTSNGLPNRITLLTGDIQARATPPGGDGQPELLIMTSEILANKLDQVRSSGMEEPDLVNVGILVIDEMHYINDPDRGHVWERTIMHLPTAIQLVALSATLSQPERFCEWLGKRRPTRLVQRHERHVPLYIGGYDTKNQFVELVSTHHKKSFETSVFHRIQLKPITSISQGVSKLITTLQRDHKLPAIVFCLSKNRCVEAAGYVGQNLLYGTIPTKGKEQDEDEFKYQQEEHQWKVTKIRERQETMYRTHLGPYRTILEALPGFETFRTLLDKGIAYHHASMIPILREYVELLFAERLIQVVFATETLAVGINMPARTTVFTQLDKPSGQEHQTQMLKPDQFWQMAGRAGRRGMDDKGFVVLFPLGKSDMKETDLRSILFEPMPPATSQLKIDPLFVLKHHTKDRDAMIKKTLLAHQHQQAADSLRTKMTSFAPISEQKVAAVQRYQNLQARLVGDGFIRLTNAQRKECEKEIHSLGLTEKEVADNKVQHAMEQDLDFHTTTLNSTWSESQEWLNQHEFIDSSNELTIKGKVASGLSDGEPLLRSTMLVQDMVKKATFEEIVSWLACFTETIRPNQPLPSYSYPLEDMMTYMETWEKPYLCSKQINYDTGLLMYIWTQGKKISDIMPFIDIGQFGTFIKAVLRVISFIDEMKPVLLGLQQYEVYNLLDNHHTKLLDGIVTNRSLYVNRV